MKKMTKAKTKTQNMKLKKPGFGLTRLLVLLVAASALAVFATGCPKRAAPGAQELDEHGHAAGTHGPKSAVPADDGHGHAAGESCGGAGGKAAKPETGKAATDAHGHATPAAKPAADACADGCGDHGAEKTAPEKKTDDGHGHGAAEEGHSDEVELTPEAIATNKVVVEPVAARALAARFTLPGRVAFDTEKTAHIGTPVAGRVAKILVQPGDAVKKGDALLVIESTAAGEAQANYLQKRMAVKTTEGALALAAAAAERGGKLKASGALSNAEIARRDTEMAAAQNALQAAQAELLAAANGLRLLGFDDAALKALAETGVVATAYTVRAPIDGVVVEREVTPGEVVGPEREALARLADPKALWVLVDAPENRFAEIAVGSAVEVTVDALAGKRLAGKVTYVAPALNEATRTALVRVVLDDAESACVLRAGMFVRAVVNIPVQGGAVLAVPEGAVLNVEGGPAVFVAVEDEPGAFQKRAITPGTAVGGWIPVLSGLKAGEKVVTSGAFLLKAELAKGIMEGKTCTGH